jgi:hypothetical protein
MTLHELFTTDTTAHWHGLRLETRYGSDPFAAVRQGHDKWPQLASVAHSNGSLSIASETGGPSCFPDRSLRILSSCHCCLPVICTN